MRRARDVAVYPSMLSLPGGFLNAKGSAECPDGETARMAMAREIMEETNIAIDPRYIHLFGENSDPDLDPRAHVVNLQWLIVVNDNDVVGSEPLDDVEEILWLPIDSEVPEPMAFNHHEILINGIKAFYNRF